MDAQALQNEAKSAISGAKTLDELDDARVRYLGRKSELKQALREVRDPETGRVLNALREELELAIEEREAALRGADLEQRLAEERVDVTLPGKATQRGHLPRPRIHDRRRGRGRGHVASVRRTQHAAGARDALAAPHAFPERGHRPTHGDVRVADPGDGGAGPTGLHRLARPHIPPRHGRCDA